MLNIFVDADGCPVKDEVYRVAWRHGLGATLVSNSRIKEYVRYYNQSRPQLSLERNALIPRSVEPSALGAVVAVPQVGGLHHRYTRAA